jgi:hypothetical protein
MRTIEWIWIACSIVQLCKLRYFPIVLIPTLLANALLCFSCQAEDAASCNSGECHGMSCLKMETSNMDNDRRTIQKSCSNHPEPTQCKQSGFGSKLITRCSCDSDFCNGDHQLSLAGLQVSSLSAHSLSLDLLSNLFILLIWIFTGV